MVNMAHDGDDRRAGLEVFLGVLNVRGLAQCVFRGFFKPHLQGAAEFAAHKGSGVKIQLAVDVGKVAKQKQLFEDLPGGLADALGQVLDRDGIRGHVGGFDLDGRHLLLGRHLTLGPGALAATDHIVIIHPRPGIFGDLAPGLADPLRIALPGIALFVGVIVADPLFFHGRGHIPHRGPGHCPPAAGRCGAAKWGPLSGGPAIRARCRAPIGALSGSGTAIGALRARCRASIGTTLSGGRTAIGTLRARRGAAIDRPLPCGRAAIGASGSRLLALYLAHWLLGCCLGGGSRGHRLCRLPFRGNGSRRGCRLGRRSWRLSRRFFRGHWGRLLSRLFLLLLCHRFHHRRFLIRGEHLGLLSRKGRFHHLCHGGGGRRFHRSLWLCIIIRHCPGLGLLTEHLLLLFMAQALFFLFFLPEELRFLLSEHLQHDIGVAFDPLGFRQDNARFLIEFFDCFLKPDFSH